MSVSGRAGLFTIDSRFSFDLRDDVHTAPRRQKSGALRLEFGQFSLATDGLTSARVQTTVNTGITAVVSPTRVPNPIGTSGGTWIVSTIGNYNSGFLYNSGVNYNSATYYIVEVSNAGQGQELINILASMDVADTGVGAETVTSHKFPTESYFVITCEGRLNPLGVIVLRDSRHELMPQTRDNTEEIPGRHGEYDFGSELKSRLMELHVATDDGLSQLQKEQLKRTIAKYLNPVAGTKKMVFLDDMDVEYEVKYAGKIDLTKYTDWMEFTIPFKMCNPFIESTTEHSQTGEGVIVNAGTFETPILIEIPGPATSPTVSVGASVIAYTSTIAAGQTLIIDTDAQTAKIGSVNAIAQVTGDIDYMLEPEANVSVVPSVSATIIKWRDKYL